MADIHPSQPTNAPVAKTRSPVERLLVWGLIGALLVAVAIEFQSRKSHQQALNTLANKVEAVDKDPSQSEVTEADVTAAVGGKKPVRTEELGGSKTIANGANRLEVYSWFTLNPTNKRELWVWYGTKGKNANELATVIEVQSSEKIAELPKTEVASEASNDGAPMAGGPGGPGGGGMSGPPPGMGGRPGGMGGPRGMGGPGGARGRPGAGNAADGSDKADADKTDADKADADKADSVKPNADKADTDTPDEKTTDDDKTGADNASEETTAEDKTQKTDPDKE